MNRVFPCVVLFLLIPSSSLTIFVDDVAPEITLITILIDSSLINPPQILTIRETATSDTHIILEECPE